jgi:hypothetical protein
MRDYSEHNTKNVDRKIVNREKSGKTIIVEEFNNE